MIEPWPAEYIQPQGGPMPTPSSPEGWWTMKTRSQLQRTLHEALSLLIEVQEYILPEEVRQDVARRVEEMRAEVADAND